MATSPTLMLRWKLVPTSWWIPSCSSWISSPPKNPTGSRVGKGQLTRLEDITVRPLANLLDYTGDEATGKIASGSDSAPVTFEEYGNPAEAVSRLGGRPSAFPAEVASGKSGKVPLDSDTILSACAMGISSGNRLE